MMIDALRARFMACALAMMSAGMLLGADTASTRPEVALASKYVMAVVGQDWTACSAMLAPKALERRKGEVLAFIKESTTMSEESAKLAAFGLATYGDLEKMTAQQFYVLERNTLNKKNAPSEESRKRQLETLKIEVISVGAEDSGHFSHVVVRTHRETPEKRVHELLLISLLQDAADSNKWWIVPDAQLPIAEPLSP